jgi:hypothetical protein
VKIDEINPIKAWEIVSEKNLAYSEKITVYNSFKIQKVSTVIRVNTCRK